MHSSSRRFSLRERTSPSHESVDSAIGSFETLADYAFYIAAMYEFRLSLEKSLSDIDWPREFAVWRPAEIATVIACDMEDLRLPVPRKPLETLRISNLSCLCGVLYVLEGSALGARVLYKRAQALGLTHEYGARHLARQSESLDSWRTFLEILDRAAPFDLEAAASSSIGAFRVAENAFTSMRCHAG